LSKNGIRNKAEDKIDPKMINFYLKKARFAMRDEDYNQAVKYYRLAAKCSAKAGDTQKEKIFNNRANEIIKEYKLEVEVEKEKTFKKKKVIQRKKEKIRITSQNIWGFIIAIIIILCGLSGLIFEIIFLPNSLTLNDMYFYWGVGATIEIISVIIIIFIYKILIKPPEIEEEKKKK